jgi:hypothetical protein
MIRSKIQVAEIKRFRFIALLSVAENAGGKNEGNLHYVIENKYRKNVRFSPFQDVIETKRVIVFFPRCC